MSAYDLNLAVQQYTTNVRLLVQQMGSRFRDTVINGQHFGKQAAVVDQFQAVSALKVSSRYAPIVPSEVLNDRRWAFPVDYHFPALVDNFDKLRLLIDPMNSYAQSAAAAMGRAMDDEIIAAFFGDSKTGETGSTTTSFLSANQIAYNFGGATGLTVAKLIEARKILMGYDVDLEAEPIFCGISAKQHANLLNEIQVVNTDYNGEAVLVSGRIQSFLGINFIHSERLPTNGSGYRRIPLYVKSAMHLGIWNDINADISRRLDLTSLPYQIYTSGTFGATRTEEKRIVEIVCQES